MNLTNVSNRNFPQKNKETIDCTLLIRNVSRSGQIDDQCTNVSGGAVYNEKTVFRFTVGNLRN